jgi:transcriptional regulator with XRE-family HTH domain
MYSNNKTLETKSFNRCLSIALEAYGITASDLAKAVEIDKSYVSHLQKGVKTPSKDIAEKIIRFFGLTEETFYALGEEPNKILGDVQTELHNLILSIVKMRKILNSRRLDQT